MKQSRLIVFTITWTQVVYSLAIFTVHNLLYPSIPIKNCLRKFRTNSIHGQSYIVTYQAFNNPMV